jgi:hypothetical protein
MHLPLLITLTETELGIKQEVTDTYNEPIETPNPIILQKDHTPTKPALAKPRPAYRKNICQLCNQKLGPLDNFIEHLTVAHLLNIETINKIRMADIQLLAKTPNPNTPKYTKSNVTSSNENKNKQKSKRQKLDTTTSADLQINTKRQTTNTFNCQNCPQTVFGSFNHYSEYKLDIHGLTEHPDEYAHQKLYNATNGHSEHQPPPLNKTPSPAYTYTNETNEVTEHEYKCKLCDYNTTSPRNLNIHNNNNHHFLYSIFKPLVIKHHKCALHRCGLCKATFYNLPSLTTHITTHQHAPDTHNLWQLKCPQPKCNISTKSPDEILNHLKKYHKINFEPDQLPIHADPSSIVPLYECNICFTAYDLRVQLNNHLNKQHNEHITVFNENRENLLNASPLQCTCCNNTFLDIHTLQQHMIKIEETPGKHQQ